MINENGHIEELFREKFSGFEVQPSPGLWKKISGNLFLKEFLSFNLGSFNVYYLSLIIAGSIAGTLFLSQPAEDVLVEDTLQTVTRNEINDPVDDKSQAIKISEGTEYLSEPAGNKSRDSRAEPESPKSSVVRKDGRSAGKQITDLTAKTEEESAGTVIKTDPGKDDTMAAKDEIVRKGKSSIPAPVADYTVSKNSGCGSLTVSFENRSIYAHTYKWQFGDGGTSFEENPSYIYDEPGEYVVTLKATGDGGTSIASKETIYIYKLPEAKFEIKPDGAVLPNDPITFYNYSQYAVRYHWDFGDQMTSTVAEPMHYYLNAGNYDVQLRIWSAEGCFDSLVIYNAFENSGCRIEFPTAFAPNPNGPTNGYYLEGATTNEVFHPVCQGVVEYQLRIFNKSGLQIYESNDVNIGWDGYINGSLARQDVYIWKVRGRFSNGKEFVKWGNVTLIVKKYP